MPEFSSHNPGTPCWVDLMSPDLDAAKSFYSTVFGWDCEDQLDDDGNHVYVMFSVNGKKVAGMGGQQPGMDPMPGTWNTYVATADCAATAAKVEAAGGSVLMPPMQVMNAGEMAVFTDPAGAAFSVWKEGEHHGAEICNEPNTLSWNELASRDLSSAMPFYADVFGWTYESNDMGGDTGMYHVVEGGDHGGLGAMMDMPAEVPAEVPSHWMVYFATADAEASASAITAAGGSVVNGPMVIPGVGSMVVAADPSGAMFSVMQPES